jgi:membrane protease YdiL (CAAX protease family)
VLPDLVVPGSPPPDDRSVLAVAHPAASPLDILETLGVVLVVIGYPIVSHALARRSEDSVIHVRDLVAAAFRDAGWVILVVCLLQRARPFDWKLPKTWKAWAIEGLWGVVLLGIAELVAFILEAVALQAGLIQEPTAWHRSMPDPGFRVAFRIFAPLAAFKEEMVFRVYLQTRMTQVFRGKAALVVPIVAALFAMYHGYAPVQTAGIFAFGIVFGISYQLNGRIPRLVIAHVLSLETIWLLRSWF